MLTSAPMAWWVDVNMAIVLAPDRQDSTSVVVIIAKKEECEELDWLDWQGKAS